MLDGCLKLIEDRLKFGFTIGTGQARNELSNYRINMIHFRRWQAVRKVRSEGIKFPKAYSEASSRLADTFAAGGEDAIKKSYLLVRKDMQNPKKRLRYYRGRSDVQWLTDTAAPDLSKKDNQ